jgi:hypothetical protein
MPPVSTNIPNDARIINKCSELTGKLPNSAKKAAEHTCREYRAGVYGMQQAEYMLKQIAKASSKPPINISRRGGKRRASTRKSKRSRRTTRRR